MTTVEEYIEKLDEVTNKALELCPLAEIDSDGMRFNCNHCPMHKAEGKVCPIYQITDIQKALQYAVAHNIQGITGDMYIDDPMVILFIKRAVILGNSVYTLRPCDDEYIRLRNLLPIEFTDSAEYCE